MRLEPAHCAYQFQPCPNRLRGVVLMGLRIAKVHQDAVTQILRHEPIEAAHIHARHDVRVQAEPDPGFGLGFEQMLMFITGVPNIRDVIPFARTPGSAEF